MLIGISPECLYFNGTSPRQVSNYHKPYFLVFTPQHLNIKNIRLNLIKKIEENKSDQNPLSKIESVGDIETYNSFWDFEKKIQVFKVFTEKFHLKRGYCCQSGCKHCPYGYDKKTNSFR